jgi:hypothetical protein
MLARRLLQRRYCTTRWTAIKALAGSLQLAERRADHTALLRGADIAAQCRLHAAAMLCDAAAGAGAACTDDALSVNRFKFSPQPAC